MFVCEHAQELSLKFPIKGQHKICKSNLFPTLVSMLFVRYIVFISCEDIGLVTLAGWP